MNNNPLLATPHTPYGAYDFAQYTEADYKPAFDVAIAEKRREIERIIANPEPATFANTILALEQAGGLLEEVSGVFFNLLHAESTDALMEISEQVIPELSALSTYIILHPELFQRIKAVYDVRDTLGLDEEEMRLLINCYEGFAESGALLPDEQKRRLEELSQELSAASLLFGQNNLKEQKRYRLHLTEEHEVSDMPESVLALARAAAEREGKSEGWVFDLSAPSYVPFMQHCPISERRREMYLAKMSLGIAGDEFDNRHHIRTLVNGKLEEAQMLGFPTFAHYALHKRMAKHPDAVYQLLDELLDAYKPVAEREVAEIEAYARQQDPTLELKAWDWSYWAERYKQAHYELDDEMLRPYFELGQVSRAIFGLATKLYDIHFVERKDIPVYHADVQVYEVQDADGSYLGLLYTDFFPRSGKQSGAWMNNFRDQYIDAQGVDHRPHIVLVMNFTPPTEGRPSLLTAGEVGTFLHEFGHALHGMFSRCRFSSLSGTSVARDFVELPSQLMENWLTEPEWLQSFALHYQTGEPIPSDYIQRMLRAKNFLSGYATCRQLSFGYLDMAWHTITAPLAEDVDLIDMERQAWAKALVLPASGERTMMSSSFSHIFSGGYSAGYYGYKWAEVLDADAYAAFQETGIFSREVAQRFRDEVLSQGDKREPMDLYLAFRGKKPEIDALLRRDGIVG